jgi:hypothetical protein
VFGNHSPVGFRFAQVLVAQVFPDATRRVNGTVEIEMHVPAAGLALLKQNMQNRRAAILLVKPAARVGVISKASCEIAACRERGLDLRPRFKLDPDSAFAVNVSHAPDQIPQAFRVQPIEQQQ